MINLEPVFKALADPTRRAIVERLARGEATVGELAAPFSVTQPAISHHLKVLAQVGLVVMTRTGRITRCRLEPLPLKELGAWAAEVERFWTGRIGNLQRLLAAAGTTGDPTTISTATAHEPNEGGGAA